MYQNFHSILLFNIFGTLNNVQNTIIRQETDTQRCIMHTYVFHAIKVESKCKGKFYSSRVDFNLNGSNWFVFASLFEFRFNPFLGTICTCRNSISKNKMILLLWSLCCYIGPTQSLRIYLLFHHLKHFPTNKWGIIWGLNFDMN